MMRGKLKTFLMMGRVDVYVEIKDVQLGKKLARSLTI